jgi:acetyl esterase/lipase
VDERFLGDNINRGVLYSSVVDSFGVHDLLMDIYRPGNDPSPSRPAIVWVFGGNFQTGNRIQLAEYALAYARRGYVAATIDYRLLKSYDPRVPLARALEAAQSDAQAAVRYLRAHAVQLAIDPARVAIGGWSAGSLTAFAVGYNYEFTGDNTDNAGFPHTAAVVIGLDGFLGTPGQMRANDPPFILFRSETPAPDDPNALPALLARAQALDIPYDVSVVPGTEHADLIRPPFNDSIAAQAAPFLRRFFCR